jgi:hypothetical protein
MEHQTRHETAIHEAGHFVVAHHLGNSLAFRLTIKPDGDTLGEVCGEAGDWNDPEEAHATLVELLAGYRAQKRIAPLGRSLRGAYSDIEQALRILHYFPEGERLNTFFAARQKADAILAAHWEQVLGIAGLLLEQDEVDAEVADWWLLYANDRMSAEDCVKSFAFRAAVYGEPITMNDPGTRWMSYIETGQSG